MTPMERDAPPSLEEREITDAIDRLEKSAGIAGCTGHAALASAQVLSLRIGELTIYRLGVLANRISEMERLVARRLTEQAKPMRFGPVEVRVTSAAAVAIGMIATYWKSKGWL